MIFSTNQSDENGRCARGLLAETEAETEASGVETEAAVKWSEARRWKVSRRPRDRGFEAEATSLLYRAE